ncbi:MAG: hypothetical protein M1819_004735 [Sarea resinae]|nr:MAG: hypothetical protein M1819_004735 [Sarea resinae]
MFGGYPSSTTTSLSSSISRYRYENGRRYHAYKAGAYCDIADKYPSASVIGTDLSPIQPTLVPPNLQFEIDDFTAEWVYTKSSFDFIHARGLYGCVADWPAFYRQVKDHLKPGGYFEQAEKSVVLKSEDGSTDNTIFARWGEVSIAAGNAFGKSLAIVDDMKRHLEEAGFEAVTEVRYKWPVGAWPKDGHLKTIGLYNRARWEEGIEGWALFLLTRYLKWTPAEVQLYLAEFRKGLKDPKIHAFQEV